MKSKRLGYALAASIVILSGSALAMAQGNGNGKGKGGGGGGADDPPGAFEPEFAGIRLGGRNKPTQLILTNSDASMEVSAHTADGNWAGVDLSVETAGLIAFVIDNTAYLQSWSSDNGFILTDAVPVYTSPEQMGPVDFSPQGDRLTWLEEVDGEPVLRVCDIHPTELACGPVVTQLALSGWQLQLVRFHPEDNDTVVFSALPPNAVTGGGIYTYTLGDGAPSHSPLINHQGFDDVGPGGDGRDPLVVGEQNGQPVFFSLVNGAPVYPDFAGFGYGFRFNCGGDALLYLETGGGGPYLAVTEFGGPVEKLTNKGWSINRGHDWMSRADCASP